MRLTRSVAAPRPHGWRGASVGAIGFGILLGLGTAAALAAGPPVRPGPPSAVELYNALRSEASRGDLRSAEMVAAVDLYLASRSLAVADLDVPSGPTTDRVEQGPLQLRIKDMGPWSITIYNESQFATEVDLSAYVARRTAALEHLASATPGRTITVVAAPSHLTAVPDFLRILDCQCAAESIIVDVFASGQWIMASGRVLGDGTDLARLEADLVDQASASIADFPGVSRKDLELTVRSLRMTVSASEALRLANDSRLLVVDPLDDIADDFAGRAAFVDVASAPDVFRMHADWSLGVTLGVSSLLPEKNEVTK